MAAVDPTHLELTYETLVQALAAVSTAGPAVKVATDFVRFKSREPTFFPLLLDVLSSKGSLDPTIRFQAVTLCKNNVDGWWRAFSPTAATDEVKARARTTLVRLLAEGEEDAVIRATIGLCVGKIGRTDYDRHWPTVFQDLLAPIKLAWHNPSDPRNACILQGCMYAFHQVVKGLTTKRMQQGKIIMRKAAEECFGPIAEYYTHSFQSWTSRLPQLAHSPPEALASSSASPDLIDLELSRLTLKVLGRLAVYGWRDPVNHETPKAFLLGLLDHFSTVHDLRTAFYNHLLSQSPSAGDAFATLMPLAKLLFRHLLQYGKVVAMALDHNAMEVVNIPGFKGGVVSKYWKIVDGAAASGGAQALRESPSSLFPERLVVQAISLLRIITTSWPCVVNSAPPSPSQGRPNGHQAPVNPDDLSISQLTHFATVLITSYLPLRPRDLDSWAMDPEEFEQEEAADRWEVDARKAAEAWTRELAGIYTDVVDGVIRGILEGLKAPPAGNGHLNGNGYLKAGATESERLLLKDAVYGAFGSATRRLRETVSLDDWLEGSLIGEAMSTDVNGRILRRRIAWLLGQWVGDDIPTPTRVKIYSILAHLLRPLPQNDLAIQLAAARSFALCDTWDADPNAFKPFLRTTVEELSRLLGVVQGEETQNQLTKTLGVVIDRAGTDIGPYAQQLVVELSKLWETLAEASFKTSILVTMTKLIEALGPSSQQYHAAACSLVNTALDPTSGALTFLQDDAILLWLAIVRQASTMTADLLSLLPLLTGFLESASDTLKPALRLLEEYCLLDGSATLTAPVPDATGTARAQGPGMLQALAVAMDSTTEREPIKAMLSALVRIVKTAPPKEWAPLVDRSECSVRMLEMLSNQNSALVITKYLVALSHIAAVDVGAFFWLLAQAAPRLRSSVGLGPAQVLQSFITQSLDKMDYLGSSVKDGKAVAAALASLVGTADEVVLGSLAEIVSAWSGQLALGAEDQDGDANAYHFEADENDVDEFDSIVPAPLRDERLRRLREIDPLTNRTLVDIVRLNVQRAQSLGSPAFAQAWAAVDPALIDELVRRLEGTLQG